MGNSKREYPILVPTLVLDGEVNTDSLEQLLSHHNGEKIYLYDIQSILRFLGEQDHNECSCMTELLAGIIENKKIEKENKDDFS